MKFGFSLVVRGEDATPETFAQTAERAEALEVDSLWSSAHVILPPQVKSGYGGTPGLNHPEHWKARYWEPFTMLSFLAGLTSKIQLGTSVVVMPMHNPIELAKQVAELDQLSRGRFLFGIGVGWFQEEFDVLGQNFRTRGARTNEGLDLMRALWGDDPVTFKGKYYSFEDAYFAPKGAHQLEPLIGAGAARSKILAQHIKLFLKPADTDAEQEAPATDLIQFRDLLSQLDRVVHRHHHHAGAKLDLTGQPRQKTEHGEGLPIARLPMLRMLQPRSPAIAGFDLGRQNDVRAGPERV
ncbi:MAG: TIGR03619 family F420-dependent LLM class oxidoreductase, partial [Pseudomonadota bacterium]